MTIKSHDMTLVNTAIRYIDAGFAVIPIRPDSKAAYLIKWSRLPFPTHADAAKWFNTERNIGVRTGSLTGIWVLDIDPRNGGVESLAAIEKAYGDLPDTLIIKTPSDGYHYYFHIVDGLILKNSTSKIAAGIDVRGEGGQVLVPPSIILGKPYKFVNADTLDHDKIVAPPQWLIKLINSKYYDSRVAGYDGKKDNRSVYVEGERHDRLVRACGALRGRGLSDEAITVALTAENEQRCVPHLPEEELNSIVQSTKQWKPEPAYTDIWRASMQKTAKGMYVGSTTNCSEFLTHLPELNNKYRLEELSDTIEIWENDECKSLKDTDISDLQKLFTKKYNMVEPHHTNVWRAIKKSAHDNRYNAVHKWLNSLEPWDKVKRIDTLVSTVYNVKDNVYHNVVSRILMYGSVARILYPGYKMDYMIILSGKQGIGKSMSIERLFEPWNKILNGKQLDKSAQERIQGCWSVEIDELSGMNRSEIDQVKSFVTTTIDRYRKPYGIVAEDHPRKCIFIGTTNDAQFLTDMTGNRRFFPVVTHSINLDYIVDNRRQLFAEAKEKVESMDEKDICKLWIQHEIKGVIEGIQEAARIRHDWEDPIKLYCSDKKKVSMPDIIQDCLGLEYRFIGGAGRIIGKILIMQGWVSKRDEFARYWIREGDSG